MELTVYLALVTASISFTISETKLFNPLRAWIKNRNMLLGNLLSCGFCLGHWIALILVLIYKPRLFTMWWPLDFLLTILIISWLAGFQWALMCFLMQKAGK